jgi:negative regulator of flagellin synthesis FlgM
MDGRDIDEPLKARVASSSAVLLESLTEILTFPFVKPIIVSYYDRFFYGFVGNGGSQVKIHDTNRIGPLQAYRAAENALSRSVGKKPAARDEVRISPEAKELLGADQARIEHLLELKRAVEDGTYRVDAMKIAEKLLPYFRN